MNDYARYLKPEVVAQLSSMELRARLVVEGFLTGLHRSPYHGFSVEFTEHRQYLPGDDIKHVDWKVYGKTDRYYVKQFEEETNLKSYILLDASRSMSYSSPGHMQKFEYASYVAAALAYLMVEQRDAVGLVVYDESIRSFLPPRGTRTYLRQMLRELDQTVPASGTDTAYALHHVAERIKRRGLVVILSDLLDNPDAVKTAFKHFRHKGNEVIVMQILDPMERSFAFGQDAVFRDLETGKDRMTQPWHIQQAYQQSMRQFIESYKTECREHAIDYLLVDTATPFDRALFEYLNKRRRLH